MDESWRMRMGMAASVNNPATIPGRKSASEDTYRRENVFGGDDEISSSSLDPEDFNDVFGGPPRSVFSRQFSSDGDFTATIRRQSNFFYQDIFQQQPKKLPEFRIPSGRGRKDNEEEDEEFYGDIFGDLRRSRSRSQSKSNSSTSVFSSSEEYSSPSSWPPIVDDVSVIAAKLRPINVSSKWNLSAKMHDVPRMPQVVPDFPFNRFHCYVEKQFSDHEQLENYRTSRSGSSRRVSSPETIGLQPNSHCSIKESVEDLQLNSPSSVALLCHDQKNDANKYKDQATQEQSMELEEEEDDDEIMSSYVIEINFDNRERTGEALGIDEAIAWAKEKCQGRSSEKEWCMDKNKKVDPINLKERPTVNHSPERTIGGCASMQPQLYKKPEESAMKEDKDQSDRDACGISAINLKSWQKKCPKYSPKRMELELLDEDVQLWSAGKEVNIQLLLSTLHHILWPNSGWSSIPLSNLKESAEVKKAYQKARLCLHPDKLQQRGATFPQKYIAEKAFPVLQDAWAAFISQDVFLSRT